MKRSHAVRVLASIAVYGCGALPAGAQAGRVPSVESVARLESPLLTETSGVAVSRAHPGILWTHNDSGDGPFVYATNARGADLGRYFIRHATAVDWEDIALGRCPDSAGSCLYIADTGDNAERRRSVAVYVVAEPPPPADPSGPPDTLPARRLSIRYQDGPHDVEALAVDQAGDLLLVSKGRSGTPKLYRIRAAQVRRDTSVSVGPTSDDLGIPGSDGVARQVTAAAVSTDGRRLVIRTYTELRLYQLEGTRLRLLDTCWLGARQPQGEAVDYLDDDRFVLTSEAAFGFPASVMVARCPFWVAPPP